MKDEFPAANCNDCNKSRFAGKIPGFIKKAKCTVQCLLRKPPLLSCAFLQNKSCKTEMIVLSKFKTVGQNKLIGTENDMVCLMLKMKLWSFAQFFGQAVLEDVCNIMRFFCKLLQVFPSFQAKLAFTRDHWCTRTNTTFTSHGFLWHFMIKLSYLKSFSMIQLLKGPFH